MPHECTNCGREFEDGSKEMLSGCPDCGGTKFQFVPAIETGATARSPASSSRRPSGDGDRGDRSADRPRSGDGDRSWPSTGQPEADEDDSSIGEFTEWPDSARRPEDRSSADAEGTEPPASDVDAPSGSGSHSRDRDSVSEHGGDPVERDGVTSSEEGTTTQRERVERKDENTAQAEARSEVVSPEELPDPPEEPTAPDDPEYGRVVSEPDEEQPSLEELREELNEQFESIRIVSPGQYELNLMELYNREEYIVSLQEDGRYVIEVPESWRDGAE